MSGYTYIDPLQPGTPSNPTPVTSSAYFPAPYPMGILAGVSPQAMIAELTALQTAYASLLAGGQVAEASYTQGDGQRMVRYRQGDMGSMVARILQLQQALGMGRGRRPIRPYFR